MATNRCSKCWTSFEDENSRNDTFAPFEEVGSILSGTDRGKLCPKCREEAKLVGAATIFDSGEWGDKG